MRLFIALLLLLPVSLSAFQKPASKPVPKDPNENGTVTLLCRLYNATVTMDSLSLYESYGLGAKMLKRAGRRTPDSLFAFTIPASKAKFYLIGLNESALSKVILGEEKEVMLYANAQFMNKARTSGSPVNKAYEQLLKRIEAFKGESDIARSNLNSAPDKQLSIEQIKKMNKRKTMLLDSLKASNPLLWRVASLQISPTYYGQPGFTNEQDFYGKQFFANADLGNDRAFDEIPDVMNAFENYLRTMLQIGLPHEQVKKFAEEQLAKIPSTSRTYRMALSGLINTSKEFNTLTYPIWVKQYMDAYKNSGYGEIGRLDYEMKKAGTFTAGFEAPDLVGMTPDSSYFSLSKLKGKVVLVDFWASWCSPCRRENPNVKANYAKYKDKGFDVLGVSLDREISAWKGAIQQDGLEWHHISDLKGWQSAHAQLYSVTSIPQTVLIDKDGRILARNIRGEQLGEKLKQIFGE